MNRHIRCVARALLAGLIALLVATGPLAWAQEAMVPGPPVTSVDDARFWFELAKVVGLPGAVVFAAFRTSNLRIPVIITLDEKAEGYFERLADAHEDHHDDTTERMDARPPRPPRPRVKASA